MKVIKLAPNDGQQISFQCPHNGCNFIAYTGNIISLEQKPREKVATIKYMTPFGEVREEVTTLSLAEWYDMLPNNFVCISSSVVVNLRYVIEYCENSVWVCTKDGQKHYRRDRWNGKHPVEIDEVNY